MYFLLFLPFVVNKDYRSSFQPDCRLKNSKSENQGLRMAAILKTEKNVISHMSDLKILHGIVGLASRP